MLYDKILVAVDGSDPSRCALSEAIRIAKVTGGTITLIHVYPLEPSQQLISATQQLNKYLKDNGKTVLANAEKTVEAEGLKADGLLIEGDAAEQIVKTASEGKFDLIVIGARGLSKLSGLILGSVSQGVVKNAPCPVLITR